MLDIREEAAALTFAVHLQPRASQNRIIGLHGDALKVQVTAPPVDGQANKNLVDLLAKTLKVARSKVVIVKGQTSRQKQVRLEGVKRASLEALFASCSETSTP